MHNELVMTFLKKKIMGIQYLQSFHKQKFRAEILMTKIEILVSKVVKSVISALSKPSKSKF